MTWGWKVHTAIPPSPAMPLASSLHSCLTSAAERIVLSKLPSENEKCAAASSSQCTGSSISEVPGCWYGRMSSMRFDA